MLIAWTTVADKAAADSLASAVVSEKLATCVQIDGPITSHYRWENRVEKAEEYRLLFKLLPDQSARLEKRIHELHPYDTPEWIVVNAQHVSEKYLSWARENAY